MKTASIDLNSSLTLRNSFLFPVQSAESRREILLGALWLLVPVVGWLMNLGHRVQMGAQYAARPPGVAGME